VIYLSGERQNEQEGQENPSREAQNDSNSGNIHIQAGRDVNLNAAYIINDAVQVEQLLEQDIKAALQTPRASNAVTNIVAGHDINMGTVTTSESHNANFDAKNWRRENSSTEIGSSILTQGDINLSAGDHIGIRAGLLESETGAINAIADTITIEAGDASHYLGFASHIKNKDMFSSGSTTKVDETTDRTLVGSSLSGQQINLQSSGDMTIRASDVVATNDVNLVSTGGNISITSGQESSKVYSYERVKESGLLSGGATLTVGSSRETTTNTTDSTYARGSTVGSLEGDININARQGSYNQTGSDLLALAGDINVVAQDINIVEARESSRHEQTYEYKQSGISIGVNSPIISAIQTAEKMSDEAEKTDSSRSKALAAGAAGLSIVNNAMSMSGAPQDATLSDAVNSGSLGFTVGIGSSKVESQSVEQTNTARGSNLTAGGSINLTATGKEDNANSGNILIQGSNISAKQDVSLAANNDIHILAASNTEDRHSSNKSSSSSLGMSITGAGVGVNISGSKGKGSGEGHDQYWTASTITAGSNLNISSGKDVNIIGSQVSGEKVIADIGGNLNIISLQETSTEHSSQSNKSGSLGINLGVGMISGSYNQSKAKGDGSYASVNEYAGIMAGDGGFDISVGGNTHLKGGVIASTEQAVKEGSNQLITGSLTTEDIDNHSEYEVKGESSGIGISLTPGNSLPGLTPGLPIKGKDSDSESSTTTSGISGGTIIITDEGKQQELTGKTSEETIEELNRDVITGELDANSLEKDWNLQELVDQMQAEMEITQEFINQGSQLVDNLDKLEAKAWEALEDLIENGNLTREQISALEEQIAQLKDDAIWGMGGIGRQIATAINAALSGNVGGANTDILQGAIVNYLQGEGASLIKDYLNNYEGSGTETEQLRTLLQGILACGGAAAQGSDCTSAALGAGGAVLINYLLQTDAEGMSAQEKQDRLNLVNGIIGGITEALGGDSNAAVIAAKVEQENNQFNPGAIGIGPNDQAYYAGAVSLYQHLKASGATDEQIQEEMDKYARGDFPVNQQAGTIFLITLFEMAYEQTPPADIEAFWNAETPFDYFLAGLGLAPGVGDAAKGLLRRAKEAELLGDIAGSKRLIEEANELLSSALHNKPDTPTVKPGGSGGNTVVGGNKQGTITFQPMAKPNANEIRAGEGLSNQGYNVEHRATANDLGQSGVRTSDLWVDNVKVDVYSPEVGTSTNSILRTIERKNSQAQAVLVQGDFSNASMQEIAARTWGKPTVDNINTIYFQGSNGAIVRLDRPIK